MAAAAGPRYAPEDPTLPKPWRGLVDGKTGYLYFWNPETNVTQYERPTSSASPSKPTSVPVSSSIQVHQSSRSDYTPVKEDERGGRGGSGGSRLDLGTRGSQVDTGLFLLNCGLTLSSVYSVNSGHMSLNLKLEQ